MIYQEAEQFEEFFLKLSQISENNKNLMEKLGEIPDEFSCPITCDIMSEPVKLPTSGMVVDKKTIKQHLLNDEIDPFNRKPLKFEMVIPQVELKKKIDNWVKMKLYGDDKKNLEMKEKEKNSAEEQNDLEFDPIFKNLK